MTTIKRRHFLGGSAAIGAGLVTGGLPRLANAQAGEITVTAFGGVWEEAVRSCFVAPFEAKTKAKANVSLGGPPQWLAQVEANAAKPPVDVLIMTPDLALTAAKADLVDDFTVEKLPNLGGGVENVDPFFAAMEKMKSNLVFWGGPNDFFNHLSSGEADCGIYFDGRTWNHYDSGATWIDFINPEEGGSLNGVAVQKPKNANPLAWDYINEVLDAQNQTKFADIMNYGVTNTDVVYSDKLKPRITPWQNTAFPPYEQIAQVRNEWVDRWNREIGR